MTNTPAATTALTARDELRAVITTVDKLFARSIAAAHTAEGIKSGSFLRCSCPPN
jgi:hypothetical protein